MDPTELRSRAAAITWFHSIDLGHGIVTRGDDKSPRKLGQVRIPDRLDGLSVLDVGAWDGFFSFEAERRGASRVLAADSYCWSGKDGCTQDGFNLAREALQSKVEDVEIEVLDLSPERIGTFDVVLFLGVLYHMKHPHVALERVASVARDLLILETHVDLLGMDRAAMAIYPERELDGDLTNWCGPNLKALEWMLRDVGFTQLSRVFLSPLWWRAGRAAKLAGRGKAPFLNSLRQARVVYHARK